MICKRRDAALSVTALPRRRQDLFAMARFILTRMHHACTNERTCAYTQGDAHTCARASKCVVMRMFTTEAD